MRTMAFKILGNLHIFLAGAGDFSREEWSGYIDAIKAEEKKGIDVTRMRTLVFSDGGGPNATQRKMASDVLNGRSTPLAIVTGSQMMRGVITALRWFNPQCRAFAPTEVAQALSFLEVTEHQYDAVLSIARHLQTNLGTQIQSLEAASRAPAPRASAAGF